MENYFKLIEQKRQQLGMTIKDLCEKANVKQMTYYNSKDNKTIPRADRFLRLCKVVGIKTLEI